MWSCPPVLCAGRDRARASGGRKKLKGATLTCSRVAPSDREGPGWVPGWRLELADHLVVVRSWLLHEPDLGLAKDDGARDWRGTRQPGEPAVSVRARIIHVAVRHRAEPRVLELARQRLANSLPLPGNAASISGTTEFGS